MCHFDYSIGICHNYLGQSNLCNSFLGSTDYIFTTINQLMLSTGLDERILPLLEGVYGECSDLISRLLCHYFFSPCGANGQLHLPLAVCQEECHYVQSTCEIQWRIVNSLLSIGGLSSINCSATGALLQRLDLCCIDAGIKIESKWKISPFFSLNFNFSLPSSFNLTLPISISICLSQACSLSVHHNNRTASSSNILFCCCVE